MKRRKSMQPRFEPRIIAFLCNWCAYGAADLAGVSRLQYPPNIRTVRVMCSATVSPHFLLRALQSGADGILVGG
jgi:F420-non-reducing hydrogenase iron-sulfur subunit